MTVRRVEKRGGVWEIDFTYNDRNGENRRYRKDSTALTKKEAQSEEKRLRANCAMFGSPIAIAETTIDGGITFQKAVDEFRFGAAITELKKSTLHGYNEILDSILLPRFAKIKIGAIDYAQAVTLDAEIKGRGCSPSRRRNVQCVLRTVLRVAYDNGRLKEISRFPPLPKVGRTNVKVMSQTQVEMIIQCAHGASGWPMMIAAFCGLRSGEIRALKGHHIDMEERILRVEESLSHGDIDSPKSGHERQIPLPETIYRFLGAGFRLGRFHRDDFVCKTKEGRPWGDTVLSVAFSRAAKKAGVEGFSFHDLRHFWVSHMFRSGASAPVVQAMAGHENLETTQRYAHVEMTDFRSASNNYEKLVKLNVGDMLEMNTEQEPDEPA